MLRGMRHLLIALCAVALAGCAQTQSRYSATQLIPREVLFGNPDKAGPQISPDGSKIAYLAPLDGVLNVWVAPADDLAAGTPITHDTHRGIRIYFFAYTNEHVLYIQDKGGDENWRVYAVDLNTNEIKDLTPIEGVNARIMEVSPDFPNEVLVGLNDRDPRYHDAYRLNILTGEKTLLEENNEFVGYVTDDKLKLRFAVRITPDGGQEMLRRSGDAWELYIKIERDDAMTTGPRGFDKTGKVLYMQDSRGRNTAALTAVDLESGETKVIAEDPQADIGRILSHPTEKTIQGAGANYLRQRWQFFDLRVKADFDVLASLADGDVNVVDRTLDDQQWLVALTVDNGPVRYYHYDREAREARFLFTHRSAWEGLPLAKMHPVIIKSRDGMNLVSYLTLPVGTDPDADARPASPLPTVLFVHGGPWGRDAWGPNPYHQWLSNRGYAVLSVNFRGSTGFGKEFVNAADMQWGAKMHDDLIDAVNWAVKERIADRNRVAIMGGSYGGYATLVGLTFTPKVFACGVDIVGPSNLVTLLESVPPYWKPMVDMWATRVGDHRTDEGRRFLTERSPLTYVDKICKPLLIGQGANDPRVKQAEADQIVQAMQAKSIPVTYVVYSDEGHGFARPENRMSFNAVTEAFLAEHLGGRFEPVGGDFQGSSIDVPTGAGGVAGLTAAIEKVRTQTAASTE